MTRVVHRHPFQPGWRDDATWSLTAAAARLWAVLMAAKDERGFLAVAAILLVGALLPLIQPEWVARWLP